jgi:transposase InsO family protein
MFYTLKEAQIIVEQWRNHYNTIREYNAWGYRPPAPEAIVQIDQRLAMH